MRETPKVRRGTESTMEPTMKAAIPPSSESEPLRKPLKPMYAARTMGNHGTSVSAIVVLKTWVACTKGKD